MGASERDDQQCDLRGGAADRINHPLNDRFGADPGACRNSVYDQFAYQTAAFVVMTARSESSRSDVRSAIQRSDPDTPCMRAGT